jgi:hypothetical protein
MDRSTAMLDQHSNIEYSITDNVLTIRVDLKRAIRVLASGNYAVCRTPGYQEIFGDRNGQPFRTGIWLQCYVDARRNTPEAVQRIRDLWPEMDAHGQQLIKNAELDPELG